MSRKEIEKMFSVFLSSYRYTRESFRELDKTRASCTRGCSFRAASPDGVSGRRPTSAAQQSLRPSLTVADESRWREPEHYPRSPAPRQGPQFTHPREVVQGTGCEHDVTISQTFIGGHLGLGGGGRAGYLGTLYTTQSILTQKAKLEWSDCLGQEFYPC